MSPTCTPRAQFCEALTEFLCSRSSLLTTECCLSFCEVSSCWFCCGSSGLDFACFTGFRRERIMTAAQVCVIGPFQGSGAPTYWWPARLHYVIIHFKRNMVEWPCVARQRKDAAFGSTFITELPRRGGAQSHRVAPLPNCSVLV